MNSFNRVLLVLYALFTTLLLIIALLFMSGWQMMSTMLRDLTFYPFFEETLWAIIIIYILASLHFVWLGLRPARKQAVVQEGQLGEVRIALTAVEDLVDRLIMQNSGIKEVKSKVMMVPQGIGIQVKTMVTPDVQIPEMSQAMQQQIRDKVLEVTGIQVQDIRILAVSYTHLSC